MCAQDFRGEAFWHYILVFAVAGLQRDRSQADQAHSRWLELSSIIWKVAAQAWNEMPHICFQNKGAQSHDASVQNL